MTNLLDRKRKWDYTSEEELTKIYQEQYNDVFSKILLLSSTQFMNVLEKQIITYLYIIKKQPILSLLIRISEYFIQKYYEDKENVNQAYQIIKQTNTSDIEYLDKYTCYLHCPHTGGAFHTCGNKFILCNDFIFCLQCRKVYMEEQAKMFCDFCGVEYYTELREVENEELETFFPVCYENQHCLNKNEEKIKCKICKEELYVDISKYNNLNKNENEKSKKIESLYCLKCKQNYKIKELDSKCSKCNKIFYSEVKIYNKFNKIKTDYLCLVHTLLKRKYAFPRNVKKRSCKCELLITKKFKHNIDKGILLEGLRYGKRVIICDKCFKIFNYYSFNWNCPECGIGLKGENILTTKELSESSSASYKINQDKNNLKQNVKYNTTASGVKTKNIYPNPNNNKSEIKNGKIIINTINDKKVNNLNINEINNSKILRKSGNNFQDKKPNVNINMNNTLEKENQRNSNNYKDKNLNSHQNLNSNRSNIRDNKKIFNKISLNENNQLINPNDKNNQTCNSLINSINSSIKLKNNFNDKNYNNNNNKTCIITFNGTNNNNENNDNSNINLLNKKSNMNRGFISSKLFSPEKKSEKIEYSLRYNNKENNKDMINKDNEKDIISLSKNYKEKIISIENLKNENKLKRSVNITESKNELNSKNKRKIFKNNDINENNNELKNARKFSNREQINTNNNTNNIIKIDLGNKNNSLTQAKSSINIHSINNNLVNNNKQYLRAKNENKNMKSPQKIINNGNISNNKKQMENINVKQEFIKRNYSTDRNKKENNVNRKSKNNPEKKFNNLNNRNKKIAIEENLNNNEDNDDNNINNIKNKDNIYSSVCDNQEENRIINNLSMIKKNQSVNLMLTKNNNSLSKRQLNKGKITDTPNETNKNKKILEDKIIQRSKGSPNHKRLDIVQSKNIMNKNINISVKLSQELTNSNHNILNQSQNGKEQKDNKLFDNKPVNKSLNIDNHINELEKINLNNNSNNNSRKNKINNIQKIINHNPIVIIQQEDNEDENSFDYNVTKSISYSSNQKNKQQKNLVENRYNNFNENVQIINENNIYIHDEKKEDKETEKKYNKENEKKEEKEKKYNKENEQKVEKEKEEKKEEAKEDIPVKPIINSIYKKNNSEKAEKINKSYSNNNSNLNLNNNNMNNDTSRNISSEGYQFNCDNYNIVHLLGEGTFGKIYLVEDPADLKKYALKKIAVSDMEELGENKKEFELLMKLSQENPSLNVVKIFGIQVKKLDKFNLVMYVLMEAAQCDWENEIRNRNQYQAYYTEEELMKILTNLTTTLASLQKLGICHRDVKPQNILCFGKDNYKLSDFGEAKKKKKRKINGNCIYDFEGDTSKQTVRGTELYMSPILFKALHDCPEVDLEYNAYKSDVFSLGLCMLLSSTLGFQALYDIRELYDNNKIKKIIEKYLSSRYSKEYIKLITSMLQIKEKSRPDFIELESFIKNNYYHN